MCCSYNPGHSFRCRGVPIQPEPPHCAVERKLDPERLTNDRLLAIFFQYQIALTLVYASRDS